MYEDVRAATRHDQALDAFRDAKDRLFATHPQSPLPADRREHFNGLSYFPHRPDLRLAAALELFDEPPERALPASASSKSPMPFLAVGRVHPVVDGRRIELTVYWLSTYGGGLFIPFRDATSGTETYGAGRYLLDTVKGADLGVTDDGRLVLDFNYAFNPSCSYDPRWACPLAPDENRLDITIEAGERTWADQSS